MKPGEQFDQLISSGTEQQSKILHIFNPEKFIEPFIQFMEENFEDLDRHLFVCGGDEKQSSIRRRKNMIFNSDFSRDRWFYLDLHRQFYAADKIIIHGLWNDWVVRFLALQPWLLHKCYWFIWGGDLYSYRLALRSLAWRRLEKWRRIAIRHMGHLVTYVEGDVELARKWYGARGKYHECLMYPSNLHNERPIPLKRDDIVNIQIGNSADPQNEHFEMLQKLEPYRHRNIRIYAPLSYGSAEQRGNVVAEGRKIFGDKFVALTEFMPLDRYICHLSEIDIALFNHQRQEAMGNIITLLGMGKKVYLRADVTSWNFFERIGVKLFDISHVEIDLIEPVVAAKNKELIQINFSSPKLKEGLRRIFG